MQVGQWISDICEKGTKKLVGLNKPFKYIVTCIIMQVPTDSDKSYSIEAIVWVFSEFNLTVQNYVDNRLSFSEMAQVFILRVHVSGTVPMMDHALSGNNADSFVKNIYLFALIPFKLMSRLEEKTMYCVVTCFALAI
jgi:hypothetical protein